MKHILLVTLLLSCSSLFHSAHAQGRSSPISGWGGFDLLLNPIVQRDLGLEPDQIAKARETSFAIQDRQKVNIARLEGLSGDERVKKARELSMAQAGEGMKAASTILKSDQFRRFLQVDLQQRGASALVDPLVAQALEISPEQIDKIQPILDRSVLQMREALSSTRGDRRASTEKIQAIRNEINNKAIAILSDAQKETWIRMSGPPLDLNPSHQGAR